MNQLIKESANLQRLASVVALFANKYGDRVPFACVYPMDPCALHPVIAFYSDDQPKIEKVFGGDDWKAEFGRPMKLIDGVKVVVSSVDRELRSETTPVANSSAGTAILLAHVLLGAIG